MSTASLGAFTIDCARRYPRVAIHAYEPDPETCELLRQNVAANGLAGRVTVWNEAVAGRAGRLTLSRGNGSIITSAFLPLGKRGESFEATTVTFQTVVERATHRISRMAGP